MRSLLLRWLGLLRLVRAGIVADGIVAGGMTEVGGVVGGMAGSVFWNTTGRITKAGEMAGARKMAGGMAEAGGMAKAKRITWRYL